jgi:hypothetical protein
VRRRHLLLAGGRRSAKIAVVAGLCGCRNARHTDRQEEKDASILESGSGGAQLDDGTALCRLSDGRANRRHDLLPLVGAVLVVGMAAHPPWHILATHMLRRSFLRMTATTAAGLALSPARAIAQGSGPGPEMRALSAYMHEAGTRALPAEAEDHAKQHVLDTLAAMISGSQLPPGRVRSTTSARTAEEVQRRSSGRRSRPRPATPHLPTASRRTRMRPMTRTTHRARTRVVRWCRRRSPPARNSALAERASSVP